MIQVLCWARERFSASRVMRHGTWGLLDQALISATTLVTVVLLGRSIDPGGFGTFSVVYTFLLLVNTVQTALIANPHSVLAVNRSPERYAAFTSGLLVMQGAFSLASLLVCAALGAATRQIDVQLAELFTIAALTIVAWQLQELARRVLYTEGRLGDAFAIDVVTYGGQSAAQVALAVLGQLTGATTLLTLLVMSAAGGVWGAWKLRHSVTWPVDWSAPGEAWRYGRWLVAAEITGSWLSTQVYFYLTATLVGAPAAGLLKALQTLFGPLRVVVFSLTTWLPTLLVRTATVGGAGQLHHQLRLMLLVIVPPIGVYCLVLGGVGATLLRWLFGPEYVASVSLVSLYATYTFVAFTGYILTSPLRAQSRTRAVFAATVPTAAISLPLGLLFIWPFGVEGAALGMLASQCCTVGLLVRAYREMLATSRGRAEPAMSPT